MFSKQNKYERGVKLFTTTFIIFPFFYSFFRHISDDNQSRLRNSLLTTSIVIFFADIMEKRMEKKELIILSIITFIIINVMGYIFEGLVLQNNMLLSFNIIISSSSCIGSIL